MVPLNSNFNGSIVSVTQDDGADPEPTAMGVVKWRSSKSVFAILPVSFAEFHVIAVMMLLD